MRAAIRHDWSVDEIRAIYEGPLLELVFEAARVHRQYHDPAEVQVCKLVSIKTGGCAEDCGYCSQSSWYETGITPQPLMDKETVVTMAKKAKENGVSRVCLGAAWREVIGKNFPAMAVVAVSSLVEPRALVEIEATAVVPD